MGKREQKLLIYIFIMVSRDVVVSPLGWATQRGLRPCTYLPKASCMIASGFRVALDLDTYPLSNLIRPRCAGRAKPGRGKPVLIMHIGVFTPNLSNADVAAKSPH